MASIGELDSIADSSAFIFIATVIGVAGPAARTEEQPVTVSVSEVIKAPVGMSGLVGRQVTVRLREPLSEGHYVFFADLVSAGGTLTVRETARLDAEQRGDAEAAVERGYGVRLAPRLEAAWLVALGTIGEVTPVLAPAERRRSVPWALAPLDIERVLKGSRARRHVTLIGPSPASKNLPRSPALRAGVHAIFLLQRPPEEAMEHVPGGERQAAGFIAETSDIQPPDRAEQLIRILGTAERG